MSCTPVKGMGIYFPFFIRDESGLSSEKSWVQSMLDFSSFSIMFNERLSVNPNRKENKCC